MPSRVTPGDQKACGRRRPTTKLERWPWRGLATLFLSYPVAHLRVLTSLFVEVLVPVIGPMCGPSGVRTSQAGETV